jgi:hypothetical protein
MFIAALVTITKLWKQPRGSTTDGWIKKMWCVQGGEMTQALYAHMNNKRKKKKMWCVYTQ